MNSVLSHATHIADPLSLAATATLASAASTSSAPVLTPVKSDEKTNLDNLENSGEFEVCRV